MDDSNNTLGDLTRASICVFDKKDNVVTKEFHPDTCSMGYAEVIHADSEDLFTIMNAIERKENNNE